MEIERKYLIAEGSFPFRDYPYKDLVQGYLSTDPVVRVRKEGSEYYLTYKGKGNLAREEHNLPLTEESFEHLIKKADGNIISKRRYFIPFGEYTIELDEFNAPFAPLIVAEVEFETMEQANTFTPPAWFGEDVTFDASYKNSSLSKKVMH